MADGLSPGTRVADFTVEAPIGRGGMGSVYRAMQGGVDRRVALKVVNPDLAADPVFQDRFRREARQAAALDHPAIIPIYAAGEDRGVLYLAMKLVNGSDLSAVIDAVGLLAPDRTAAMVTQIAGALDTAHAAGLIHRDVKPTNILIEPSAGGYERAYLTDFGLVRGRNDATLTRTGTFMGSPAYMSPEQIRGEPLDGRSDQYALACVIYEALTGGPPFVRDGDMPTLFAHLNTPAPQISNVRRDLPPALDVVLARGLAKVAADRFSTCAELAAAFGRALASTPPAPRPVPPPPAPPAPVYLEPAVRAATPLPPPPSLTLPDPPRRRRRRWPAVLGVGAAGVLAAVAVVLIVASSPGRGRTTTTTETITSPHTLKQILGTPTSATGTFPHLSATALNALITKASSATWTATYDMKLLTVPAAEKKFDELRQTTGTGQTVYDYQGGGSRLIALRHTSGVVDWVCGNASGQLACYAKNSNLTDQFSAVYAAGGASVPWSDNSPFEYGSGLPGARISVSSLLGRPTECITESLSVDTAYVCADSAGDPLYFAVTTVFSLTATQVSDQVPASDFNPQETVR